MIIADTSFFVALGNQNDQAHQLAVQVLNSLNEVLITTYPVITETCYLLARGGGNNAQLIFLREVAEEAIKKSGKKSDSSNLLRKMGQKNCRLIYSSQIKYQIKTLKSMLNVAFLILNFEF